MKLLSSLSPPFSYLYFSLFMQHPKNHDSNTRKPWYQRAMGMGILWKGISKSTEIPSPSGGVWKTMSKSPHHHVPRSGSSSKKQQQQLRKCTSLKVATSFTRVCLCAPISSYNEVFRAEVPPRRSNSFPRVKPLQTSSTTTSNSHSQERIIATPSARLSTEGRRVFRGKSLTDDVLMRRFVIEEEAMMQIRRRNQMEVIRRRSMLRRNKLGPSPLRRMAMAQDQHEQ